MRIVRKVRILRFLTFLSANFYIFELVYRICNPQKRLYVT